MNKLINNKKNVDKHMHYLDNIILFITIIIYLLMFIDTNSLMKEVKEALLGNIPSEITQDRPIAKYNIRNHFLYENTIIGQTTASLHRYLTIHNFQKGYIWAIYSNQAYDINGKPFSGSYRINTKWKIHKINGKWEIVEIFEAP